MKAAARRAVIISEPIRNPSSPDSWLGRVAIHLSNPGVGEYGERFDLPELRALASAHGVSEFLHAEATATPSPSSGGAGTADGAEG
jgi:hypothetical protein